MPFRDIVGHEHVLGLLSRAAVRGTLPPSLIFAGPSGVGKHLAAVALAQLLNCEKLHSSPEGLRAETDPRTHGPTDPRTLGPTDPGTHGPTDPCAECAACRRIARRVHADVLFLEPGETGSIKIEQIREAIERSAYRPFEGRRRVVIINDADAIVSEAQNALLKTLEEPPPASTFVLITDRPDTLLPTVRSRCQRIRFGSLAPADVAGVLMRQHAFDEKDAHAAASLSEGSIGRALEEESEPFVAAREAALQLLQRSAATSAPGARIQAAIMLPGAGRGKADRDALAQSLVALSSILRDLGLLSAKADPASLANADLKKPLESLLRAFHADRILSAFSSVGRALEALDRNASPKIVADWLALQL
jgi:DNA polymerase-3 subunit delta'